MGASYALERIARDSEKDHGPIMEVLTTYVRENAPWPPEAFAEAQKKRPWARERPADNIKEKSASTPGIPKLEIPKLDADIQAVLTVIGRRSRNFEKGETQRLDLTNMDLRNANLSKAHLEGALLSEAHLEGAYFRGVHLGGAQLWEAHLEGADLSEAKGLTQEQIDLAFCDDKTKLPPGLKLSKKKEPRP